MEIDVIYSQADPNQRSLRDFIVRFVEERGILAKICEHVEKVSFVELIIDGMSLKEKRQRPRPENPEPYPSLEIIAQTIEQRCWG